MVKRFSIGSEVRYFYEDGYETHFMEEDEQGGYVKYEDYLALVAQVELFKTELMSSAESIISRMPSDEIHHIRQEVE
jgi:hypothetical protein